MKLVKTASGKQTVKMSKQEWQDIGKKAQWEDKLPMPLYDDINKIQGEIMAWIEGYMDNYPQEQWKEKQSLIYSEIAKFCNNQANTIASE